MNKELDFNASIHALTLEQMREVYNNYEELSSTCAVGDCLLRRISEVWGNTIAPALSMTMVANAVDRRLAGMYLDTVKEPDGYQYYIGIIRFRA